METTNSLQEAKRFIETLFSHHFKDHDGYVEVRLIKEGEGVRSVWLRKGQIADGHWQEICQLNRSHHVFVGVNPRPLSKLKKQSDIKDVVCLWVDVDGKDFEGGKEEARQKVEAFAPTPSLVVDSGHGYHCYWILSEPIIGLAERRRTRFKEILAGVVKALGADKSKLHFDACLRLPGTMNIKGANVTECGIVNVSDRTYRIDDFEPFIDSEFEEPEDNGKPLPEFGTKTKEIRRTNPEDAVEDVGKLEISSKIKNLIITGSLLREKSADRTRSGRDFSIICALIFFDYDYKTIQSVFSNPFLGCSNRILQEGEDKLVWDVKQALRKVKNRVTQGTPQSMAIAEIKAQKMAPDEKRLQINAFITRDLLTGPEAAGQGFTDSETGKFYFFDSESKSLMHLEGLDFYCFMRERFGISKAEFEERKDAMMTAIWGIGTSAVSHKFAHWDRNAALLYVSDHDNGIYKLDGQNIEFCPNGTDGVFFEYNPLFTPWKFTPDEKIALYFEVPKPDKTAEVAGTKMRIPAGGIGGLDLEGFFNGGSLLKRFVIDRASFIRTDDNPLSPTEQQLVLLLYIYSQLFESQLREKPIACLVGIKESGKSFLATSIGKLFFGDKFESRSLPQTAHDLAVVMAGAPYLVIDNLDSGIKGDMLNTLCAAATGVTESNRALFTDSDVVSFTLHCFLAITSREPKFTRDDFVSRLLLFNTQKIDAPISRSELVESLVEGRNAIMSEILANANGIIKRLKAQARAKKMMGPNWQPFRCISRNADWETWSTNACSWRAAFVFRNAIDLMNEAKNQFALEGDYLFQTLYYSLYERKDLIRNVTPQHLYNHLLDTAEKMNIANFPRAIKSAVAMAARLRNIAGELRQMMEVEIIAGSSRKKTYTFKAFGDDRPDPVVELSTGKKELVDYVVEAKRPRISDAEALADVKRRAKKAKKNVPHEVVEEYDEEPEEK